MAVVLLLRNSARDVTGFGLAVTRRRGSVAFRGESVAGRVVVWRRRGSGFRRTPAPTQLGSRQDWVWNEVGEMMQLFLSVSFGGLFCVYINYSYCRLCSYNFDVSSELRLLFRFFCSHMRLASSKLARSVTPPLGFPSNLRRYD